MLINPPVARRPGRPEPPPAEFFQMIDQHLARRRSDSKTQNRADQSAPLVLTRAKFDQLDALDKARHIRRGGKVIDG
jgi:hypothetical protein